MEKQSTKAKIWKLYRTNDPFASSKKLLGKRKR
jgi:hypothetical protein